LPYIAVVLSTYGRKFTFTVTVNALRVSENRVVRRIFSLKRDEVMAGWRALHNEELHNLYPSPSVIQFKEDEMEGT
jgi:hypothetical protein